MRLLALLNDHTPVAADYGAIAEIISEVCKRCRLDIILSVQVE